MLPTRNNEPGEGEHCIATKRDLDVVISLSFPMLLYLSVTQETMLELFPGRENAVRVDGHRMTGGSSSAKCNQLQRGVVVFSFKLFAKI